MRLNASKLSRESLMPFSDDSLITSYSSVMEVVSHTGPSSGTVDDYDQTSVLCPCGEKILYSPSIFPRLTACYPLQLSPAKFEVVMQSLQLRRAWNECNFERVVLSAPRNPLLEGC